MLLIKVKSRFFMPVGEKKQRLRKSVELNEVTLYELCSEPYGLSRDDVEKRIEDNLADLRTSLAKSGIQTEVIRESI